MSKGEAVNPCQIAINQLTGLCDVIKNVDKKVCKPFRCGIDVRKTSQVNPSVSYHTLMANPIVSCSLKDCELL
jgi:hypothetical protein